jgi:ketosteroid isomerase-like protein
MQISDITLDADAAEFVQQCHEALGQHTGGDPRPFLALWSGAPDVSLMGGVGGHQVGLDSVTDLLTAAAKTLDYTGWTAETLAAGFGEELGFTIEIETLTRQFNGSPEQMQLRATSIYRRENGAWRVIHRHGDSLMKVEIDPEGRR